MTHFGHDVGLEVSDLVMPQGGKPPVGQLSACSMVKDAPQAHLLGRLDGCQPYRKQSASRKSSLCKAKLWSSIGSALSHEDATFSFPSSIARFCCADSSNMSSSAVVFCWSRLICLTSSFIRLWLVMVSME